MGIKPLRWSWIVVGWFCGLGMLARAAEPQLPVTSAETTLPLSQTLSPGVLPELQEQRTAGPYCGLYSLWACLNALGITSDPRALVSRDYVGSFTGSTGAELVKAAEHCGAHAKGFTQLTIRDLKRARGPMILHFRGSWLDQSYNHWVAFLGIEGNTAMILDPPHAVEAFSLANVLANWDGMALVVSRSPVDNSLLNAARADYAINATVVLGLAWALRRMLLSHQEEQPRRLWRARSRRLAGQMAWMVGVASVFGIGYHALAETGFLRNPAAVAEVTRRYYSVQIPERSFAEMKAVVERGDGLIVDARLPQSFQAGAIPGAISIPVDSTLPERQQILQGFSPSAPMVIYCQTSGCRYADEVATFLKFNGYLNLSIYRGGYRDWIAHMELAAKRQSPPAKSATKQE